MNKKLLSFILVVCMTICMLLGMSVSAEEVASGSCGDGLTWSLDDDGILVISGSGAMYDYNWGATPWYSYSESIRKVTIGPFVESIGSNAFLNFTSLSGISIPSGIMSIGSNAFSNCISLRTINVDATNRWYTSVDGVLFDKDMSTLIQYPNGKFIDTYNIPEGVTTLGNGCFNSCVTINILNIPASVEEMGWSVLAYAGMFVNVDSENKVYSSSKGSLFTKDMKTLLYCYNDMGITLVIPKGVSIISDDVYAQNTRVNTIVLPEGVTEINSYAFSYCENLHTVYLPESLKKIAWYGVFSGTDIKNVCYGGTREQWSQIDFEGGQENEALQAFANAEIHYTTDYLLSGSEEDKPTPEPLRRGTIGDNLTWLLNEEGVLFVAGKGAMDLPRSYFSTPWEDVKWEIKEVVISEGVTEVGYSAFRYCGNLKKVTLPQTVTKLHHDAFAYCYALTDIELPKSLAWVSSGIFYRNYSLREMTIPVSLKYMGMMTFIGCNFDTFVYEGTREQWNQIEFESGNIGIHPNYITYSPFGGSIDSGNFSSGLTWSLYNDGTLIISGNGAIKNYTYSDVSPWGEHVSQIKSVIIKDGITAIGDYTFKGCSNLNSITLPYSVSSIGGWAFSECTSISDVYYAGSEEQFRLDILMGLGNEDLTSNATKHYGSVVPTPDDIIFGAVPKEAFEQKGMRIAKIKLTEVTDGDKSVIIGGQPLYYSVQTKMYVGVVAEDSDTNDMIISNAAPVILVYGNVNDNYNYTDISKAVDGTDVLFLKRFNVGTVALSARQLFAADVNGDGKVDGTDVLFMKRFTAGTVTTFPVLN